MGIVIRAINAVKIFLFGVDSYQDKRSNNGNWEIIFPEIIDSKNLLDVACDAGYYTIESGKCGIQSYGFDIRFDSLKRAHKRAKKANLNNVFFYQLSLTTENVKNLPRYDTVLCLSVFHHFVRLYGEDLARQIIIDLFNISLKRLILQISDKKGKYKNMLSVDFKEDEGNIRKYIYDIFKGLDKCKIKYLGAKVENNNIEKLRHIYTIEHLNEF
jgi:SAM-dependent methyltransferase